MSSKDRLLEYAKARTVVLMIVFPLIMLGYYFWVADDMHGDLNYLSYVFGVLLIPFLGLMFWLRRQRHKSKLRGSQWKQRIEHIADSTDHPYDIFTFDEFCEFTDESELERTIEFLEQMPKGQRNVNEAYAKVLAKYGGPI